MLETQPLPFPGTPILQGGKALLLETLDHSFVVLVQVQGRSQLELSLSVWSALLRLIGTGYLVRKAFR